MRVLVCGGREYSNYEVVWTTLSRLPKGTVIVHGAARGADSLAALAATQLGFEVEAHPVTKEEWKTLGKKAGVLRNQDMLETGVDLVIAFPGGRGTYDMIERSYKAGVPVIRITE